MELLDFNYLSKQSCMGNNKSGFLRKKKKRK